jgi:hypothetical protein
MPFKSRVTYKGHPDVTMPMVRQAMKDAKMEIPLRWHREFLPKHFQLGAVSKYNYQPRTAKYMRGKAKHKGHQRPLVFSGVTERMATQFGARVSGTSKRSRVTFRVPLYIGFLKKTGIDLQADILETVDQELESLEASIDNHMRIALDRSASITTGGSL